MQAFKEFVTFPDFCEILCISCIRAFESNRIGLHLMVQNLWITDCVCVRISLYGRLVSRYPGPHICVLNVDVSLIAAKIISLDFIKKSKNKYYRYCDKQKSQIFLQHHCFLKIIMKLIIISSCQQTLRLLSIHAHKHFSFPATYS